MGSLSFSKGIFPIQGLNPGLPHCRWILYQLSHKGSPRLLEWVAYLFSSGSSQSRNRSSVSCISGKFFTNWAIREVFIKQLKWKIVANPVLGWMWRNLISYTFWWECQMVQPPLEIVWQFLIKLNILLIWPHDSGIALLDIYLRKMKTYVHTKTCTLMFLRALVLIANILATTKTSFSEWMTEQTLIHPCNGLILNNKKAVKYWYMQKFG